MPKSRRDLLRRDLAHIVFHLDTVGARCEKMIEVFKPIHPEFCEGLEAIQAMVLAQEEMCRLFALAAWGHENPDWRSWRCEPDDWKGLAKDGRSMD